MPMHPSVIRSEGASLPSTLDGTLEGTVGKLPGAAPASGVREKRPPLTGWFLKLAATCLSTPGKPPNFLVIMAGDCTFHDHSPRSNSTVWVSMRSLPGCDQSVVPNRTI